MISGEARIVIERSAADICTFLLDFDRYRLADPKIRKVHSFKRTGNEGVLHCSGRLRALRTPSDRQRVVVEPYRRVVLRSIPSRWPGSLARFEGSFEFDEGHGGTVVLHRESFWFARPFSWLLEPYLRKWLANDTPQELKRLKVLVEGEWGDPA